MRSRFMARTDGMSRKYSSRATVRGMRNGLAKATVYRQARMNRPTVAWDLTRSIETEPRRSGAGGAGGVGSGSIRGVARAMVHANRPGSAKSNREAYNGNSLQHEGDA